MSDPVTNSVTCDFIRGTCPRVAVVMYRNECPACGKYRVLQYCPIHARVISERVEQDTNIVHRGDPRQPGCGKSVSSAVFYTKMVDIK